MCEDLIQPMNKILILDALPMHTPLLFLCLSNLKVLKCQSLISRFYIRKQLLDHSEVVVHFGRKLLEVVDLYRYCAVSFLMFGFGDELEG
jgi:hypothetical protein